MRKYITFHFTRLWYKIFPSGALFFFLPSVELWQEIRGKKAYAICQAEDAKIVGGMGGGEEGERDEVSLM